MNTTKDISKRGKLIVLEGLDGSGKGTQFHLLKDKLIRLGKQIHTVDYPVYGRPSCHFVEAYLNGEYGSANEVGPYKASLFYAMDRFPDHKTINDHLNKGVICLANRYETSNRGYQGQKIHDLSQRKKYFEWNKNMEYEILGIPRPNLVIFLHVPHKISYELVAKKAKREYIQGKVRDIHEADINILKRAESVYKEMAQDPEWELIDCVQEGRLISIEEIHEKVINVVKKYIN